jgi:tRNA U34 5-methylaminomethyl-2-thiouridine-forming methyltransferase MnmC
LPNEVRYSKTLRSKKDLILCEDDTYTLYSKEFDEPYHSTKDGALHESLEKYVKPALALKSKKKTLVILDVCFGLGYNTLATLYYIKKYQLDIYVHILAPEFDEGLVRSLDTFPYPEEFTSFKVLIETLSRHSFYEDSQCKIEILLGDARETIPRIQHQIDIIYQDAFSPKHNPLLWTREYFQTIRAICHKEAILMTYSTAAAIRLGLYENGFYLFIHRAEKMRYSTIASLEILEDEEYIDMELKKIRNPIAKSMRDIDCESILNVKLHARIKSIENSS